MSGSSKSLTKGLADVVSGLRAWRTWSIWAWMEIRGRYRRSVIGPWWLTLSLAITIVGLGVVFSAVFQSSMGDLLPHIALGLIFWMLISTIISESCLVYVTNRDIYSELAIPHSLFLLKLIYGNLVIFAHHMAIYIAILVFFGVKINANTLLVIPGFVLLLLNLAWISVVISIICARYRDIPLIVMSILQLTMFVTPIFWKADFLQGRRQFITEFNFVYHLLEVVREPLLGELPDLTSYLVLIAAAVIGSVFALTLHGRFRHRLVFWV